jgi:CRISPR-associated endonuclease/helicase Cas3
MFWWVEAAASRAKTLYVGGDSAYSRNVVKKYEIGQFLSRYFPQLSGVESGAYHWQEELFKKLIEGDWPRDVCLPTGMGKTSVMVVWLLALAWEAVHGRGLRPVARRLVWVVDRRVVVDQATTVATRLAEQVQAIPELKDALSAFSATGEGLAVSTLRGELADNGDWCRDPSRPAVIIGTVDMVGSRLLFRGYGDGKWWRPQRAGLLGRDTIIVNDESHLTPAFAKLLQDVAELQNDPAFRVMRLSATPRGSAKQWPESVQTDVDEREQFRTRFEAPKRLFLHAVAKRDLEQEMFRLATVDGPGTRVLVFVRQPERAAEFAGWIAKGFGAERVSLLTGTMRGWERDGLVKSDAAFGVFLKKERPAERYWLVATSAGEVGVDLTSDLLITDLETADHLIQRFGRLNRFGETEGVAHLLHAPALEPKQEREKRTLEYFAGLPGSAETGYDISCRCLHENRAPEGSLSAEPPQASLDSRLIDLWSQTSVGQCAAVPPVADWLHGKQDDEWPETQIAWRAEVGLFAGKGVDEEEWANAMERYPVLARERLKEPTKRVMEKLASLPREEPAVCILPDGTVRRSRVGQLADRAEDLAYATVLLRPGCGGIVRGMFQPLGPGSGRYDVADLEDEDDHGRYPNEDDRKRYVAVSSDDGWVLTKLGASEAEAPVDSIEAFARDHGMKEVARVQIPNDDSEENPESRACLLYFRKLAEKKDLGREIKLTAHSAWVAKVAREMAEKVGLGDLAEVFATAGEWHDAGKGDPIWQAAVGGCVEDPLAKPKRQFAPGRLGGFRHEFSSLRRLETGAVDELALHLIASHHGWARPFFRPKAYDRRAVRESERTAMECARRFGRLQEKWGAWRLAYLEAIFKAADADVSRREKEQPNYA